MYTAIEVVLISRYLEQKDIYALLETVRLKWIYYGNSVRESDEIFFRDFHIAFPKDIFNSEQICHLCELIILYLNNHKIRMTLMRIEVEKELMNPHPKPFKILKLIK